MAHIFLFFQFTHLNNFLAPVSTMSFFFKRKPKDKITGISWFLLPVIRRMSFILIKIHSGITFLIIWLQEKQNPAPVLWLGLSGPRHRAAAVCWVSPGRLAASAPFNQVMWWLINFPLGEATCVAECALLGRSGWEASSLSHMFVRSIHRRSRESRDLQNNGGGVGQGKSETPLFGRGFKQTEHAVNFLPQLSNFSSTATHAVFFSRGRGRVGFPHLPVPRDYYWNSKGGPVQSFDPPSSLKAQLLLTVLLISRSLFLLSVTVQALRRNILLPSQRPRPSQAARFLRFSAQGRCLMITAEWLQCTRSLPNDAGYSKWLKVPVCKIEQHLVAGKHIADKVIQPRLKNPSSISLQTAFSPQQTPSPMLIPVSPMFHSISRLSSTSCDV